MVGIDQVIRVCLIDAFPRLRELGYRPTSLERSHSALLGDEWQFRMQSEARERSIFISYTQGKGRFDAGFATVIESQKKGEGHFSLAHYLKAHDRDDLIERLSFDANNADVEHSIRKYFAQLEAILISELRPIIEGTEWEEVPFDWKGYR